MGLAADDTISFTKQAASWEVDLDFSLDRVAGDSGSLDYKIEATDPLYTFNLAALSTLLTPLQPFPLGDFVVTKSIYSDPGFSIPLLTLTNNEDPSPAGTLVANGPLSATTIYVRDTWSIAPGSNVDLTLFRITTPKTPTASPVPCPCSAPEPRSASAVGSAAESRGHARSEVGAPEVGLRACFAAALAAPARRWGPFLCVQSRLDRCRLSCGLILLLRGNLEASDH
jgi:hypothetical protein